MRRAGKLGPIVKKWTGVGILEKMMDYFGEKPLTKIPVIALSTVIEIVIVILAAFVFILTFGPIKLWRNLKDLFGLN